MTETILLLFFGFVVKHFLCDFVLQFNNMIREKGTYGARGGLYHAGIHGWFTFVVLIPFFPAIAILAGIIDFLIHYHIDWAKMKLTKNLSFTDRNYWVWFGLDQMLHYLTYIAIIAWVVNTF